MSNTSPSERRKGFAQAVFRGYSAAEACRMAGYSPNGAKQAGNRLLRHPEVVAELSRLRAERAATETPAADPLEYLLRVMNDADTALQLRMRAAIAAAAYMHQRPGRAGKKEAAEERARKTGASGRFAPASPPLKLVRTDTTGGQRGAE